MSPSRPYLVRAIYEWLVDNRATPYLLIDATASGVRVPLQYVKDGKIVLNIAPHAVKDLLVRNEDVTFSARFNGAAMSISAPMSAVLAIYARENGQGMFFDANEEFSDEEGALSPSPEPVLAPVALSPREASVDDDEMPERPRPTGGRPTLHVVK